MVLTAKEKCKCYRMKKKLIEEVKLKKADSE